MDAVPDIDKDRGMNRLENAQKRLDAAVARLEKAMARQPVGQSTEVQIKALAAAREEQAALKAVTDTVATRLDDTIARLRRLLGDTAK